MPYTVILALYSILILIYALISLFIIYHLLKYSTNHALKTFSVLFFAAVSTGLLLSNVLLFFSIDWNALILSVFR